MISGNSIRIVAVATAFNLLFEYSLRGLNSLPRNPVLPFVLIAIYASLFVMLDDLIRRYRLKPYHLVVLAFGYGIVYQCLVSGAAFVSPGFAGIAWGHTLFTILIWWAPIQSILTFYIANRIAPRDWRAPLLTRGGWAAALAVNLLAIGLFQASGRIPDGTRLGYLTMVVVFVAAALVLRWKLPPREARNAEEASFSPRTSLDVIAAVTVGVFAFCAVLVRGGTLPAPGGSALVNAAAVVLLVPFTIAVAVALYAYRLTGRSVPV